MDKLSLKIKIGKISIFQISLTLKRETKIIWHL